MTKLYGAMSYLCGSLAIAMLMVGLMAGGGSQAWAIENAVEEIAITVQCSPTTTTTGSAPCYDVAGAQCYYGDKQSTCTASPNGSNCTCGAI
jgi:hypothetical protein